MRPLALHIGPYGKVLRMSGHLSGTSSGRPRDVILPNGNVFCDKEILMLWLISF